MPKIAQHILSPLQIERLQPTASDKMYNDGGGLYLFVRSHGTKEWIFRYSSPVTSARRKQSIGTYPDTTLKQARVLAGQKRDLLSAGLDPLIESDKRRIAEQQRLISENEKRRNTVMAVFQSWKTAELQNRKDEGDDTERAFKKDVFPVIGRKAITDVDRNDIKLVLERPLKRKRKRMANRLLSDLRQFFGYVQDEELIDRDPTRRLKKDRVGGKEKLRERFLNEAELKLLSGLLPKSGLQQQYQHIVLLLLATGCRVNEILRAEWKHIDPETRILFIPADHAKNGRTHQVYLSSFAMERIKALAEFRYCDFLVPGKTGKKPLARQSLTKLITDRQQEEGRFSRLKENRTLILPGGRWVLHDLRRTAATCMQELGIMPHVIKKCLNQKIDDPIVATYQRAAQIEQQQNAFQQLGDYLANIFGPN